MSLFNKKIDLHDYQKIFYFLLENNQYIDKVEQEFFDETVVKELNILFKIVKKFYTINSAIPSIESIQTVLKSKNIEILPNVLKIYMNWKDSDYANIDKGYMTQIFIDCYQDYQNEKVLDIIIDKKRDYNNPEARNIISDMLGVERINLDEDKNENPLNNTPTLKHVYDDLPDFFRKIADSATDIRDKDVILLSSLTTISSVFPKLFMNYHGFDIYPTLFTIISAPASTGKSIIKNAGDLLNDYNNDLYKNFVSSKNIFDKEKKGEFAETKKEKKKEKDKKDVDFTAIEKIESDEINIENAVELVEPKLKEALIGANISHSALLNWLSKNGGEGCLFDTEIKVLIDSFKQEWGDFSTTLLQAFHHETITKSRVNEYIKIIEAKLSICLSGTINQLFSLITDNEDGLFSRFIYYVFAKKPVWKDSKTIPNYQKIFNPLSEELIHVIRYYSIKKIEFDLKNEQWDKFNKTYEFNMENDMLEGEDLFAVVTRNGVVFLKILMIFTVFRKYEQLNILSAESEVKIYPDDKDFDNAMKIVDVLRSHSKIVYNNLTEKTKVNVNGINKDDFEKSLPDIFNRETALSLGKKYEMSRSTVDRKISLLLKNKKIEHIDETNKKSDYKKIK